MAKNNALINQYRSLEKKVHNVVPEVYAGIALALHRKHGWGFQRINDLFALSQDIWNECGERKINMIQMCEEETGIELRRKD